MKKNGKKVLVNAKDYKVTKDGMNITIGGANATYELLNKDDAKAVSNKIIKSVKVSKDLKSVKAGKKTEIIVKADNKSDNVKKITYITSNKSVAVVNKDGKIITKQKGKVTVKAKVTLINGKTKTVSMKVNVK